MIAGMIEPGIGHLISDFDHQGIAFQAPQRMPHPRVDRRLEIRLVHVNNATGASELVGENGVLWRLHDLKREWHIIGPRNAGHITFDCWILRQPVSLVGLLLGPRFFCVGDFATDDNTHTGR